MKKIFSTLSLSLFLVILTHAQVQDLFYYTFDKQKPLYLNQESFSVTFTQDVSWHKMVRAEHPLIKEIHALPGGPSQNIIFELKNTENQSLDELVKEFILYPEYVKDMHWGFHINPELPVWLTDKILYAPSKNWNIKTVNNILLRYPGSKLQKSDLGHLSILVSKLEHSILLGNELVEKGMVNWAQPDFMGGLTLFHTPVDPKFDKQYTFHNIGQSIDGVSGTADMDVNAEEAWDLSFGSSSVTVGILDEGVEAHEDLEDGMGASRVLPGFSAAGTGTGESQVDHEGHGQAVAGLIGATHNTLGIAGIAPNTQIVSAYVAANPATAVSHGVAGMRWLWKIAQVDIINNAYGFKSCDQNLYPAFVEEIDSAQLYGRGGLGAIVIYASGENGPGMTCVNFPGNRPNVITIGAVDGNGTVPFYCPFGPAVDVVVPSAGTNSNVRSIDRMDNATSTPDKIGLDIGNYVDFFGGTSTSCAVASGIAALVLSEDPNLDYSDVETIMTGAAMDLGSPGKNDSVGYGLLRADDAVSLAIGGFPVEWLDFSGRLQNDEVNLAWITANEQNNAFFEIQRSNGGRFSSLGKVSGAGSTTELTSYTFTDKKPQLGKSYYRLKQVDINGSFSYSSVIEISWSQVNSLTLSSIYPNPSQDKVFLNYALPRGTSAGYQVIDLQGREIHAGKVVHEKNVQSLEIQVSDWAPGLYVLIMKSNTGKLSSQKFLVSQ